MFRITAFLGGLILVACAGSGQQRSPPDLHTLRIPDPPKQPAASLSEQEEQDRWIAQNEARMREEMEPRPVRIVREVLSPNPNDARYTVPAAYTRFQRPWSPTLGSPATAP
jgi:hypothetical protein